VPAVEVGQSCNAAGCPQGTTCITADAMAASPTYTCVAVALGDVGARCDDLSAACQPGLYCQGEACAPLGGSGAACGEGPRN
jgi:hypothetical protein